MAATWEPRDIHVTAAWQPLDRNMTNEPAFYRYINRGDELISIQTIDPGTHGYNKYTEQRSILSESPVFARFFESPHFQPHADTTLIFTKYPAIVLETALCYLYIGDSALVACRSHLLKFKIPFRVSTLIRIFLLAKQLDIPGLVYDTFVLLRQLAEHFTPAHCIMLVQMFYGVDAVRDTLLKAWANQCIAVHLTELDHMPEFVHLRKTSWLKFEYDRMPSYDALPHADDGFVRHYGMQQQQQEEDEKEESLYVWEAGAPPGAQLGPAPALKKAEEEGEREKGERGERKRKRGGSRREKKVEMVDAAQPGAPAREASHRRKMARLFGR